jgi:Protein of unknown function (DUF1236)
MFNRFMITAATAALIAGTGFAYAQGSMSREGPGGGAGVQQSAPSSPSAGGATSRESSEGMKASQSEEKGGLRNQRAQDTKPGALGEKSTGEKSAQETGKGDKSKSISSQNEKGAPGKDATGKDKDMRAGDRDRSGNMKAEGREGRDGNMKAEGRDNNPAAESRSQTTGQAGASAKLSTEQRTQITTIIRNQRVAPATNINFAVSVGTRVPRDIGFHPLPAEIVTIYPEWRGYEFFLVRDEIVVVDPRTLEIVAVLPA